MTGRKIVAHPLTREAFAPFGAVIDKEGGESYPINGGKARRFHARAKTDVLDGAVVLNIFEGSPYLFPLKLELVERHPHGSQAFMPLTLAPFLVVVAEDMPDGPGEPQAFVTHPGQGVSYNRNTWHGVLMPIEEVQDFLVVDYGGDQKNLEEFRFEQPWEIHLPGMTV